METRNGLTHTFTSIDRNEYHQLYDFVSSKKLRVKNIESESKGGAGAAGADAWSSSDESHDAYMEKVKTEARERELEIDDDDDDEDDEDFQPPPESDASELAEEYDSNVQTTDSEDADSDSDDDASSGSRSGSGSEPPPKPKKIKPEPPPKQKPEKQQKKTKRTKDPNAPTRPLSAYFLWFNENRESIVRELGGSNSVSDVARAAGEKWRNMNDEAKAPYIARMRESKEKYDEEMRVYKAKIASGEIPEPSKARTISKGKAKSTTATKSPRKPTQSGNYKSAEYVASGSDDLSDLSDDDEGGGKNNSASELSN